MKTDPFGDAIRRKLEGVNPPFQEKSWTQFQRFMGSQGFPPSLWQTPTRWLQPALMAVAVTGVIISTIWQYRTTQALTENVQSLTKTVQRMEQAQGRLQESLTGKASVPVRVDTVYVTKSTQSGSMATRIPDARQLAAGRPLISANPTARQQPDYVADQPGSVLMPPEAGRSVTRRSGRAGTLPNNDQPAANRSTQSTSRLSHSNEPILYTPSVTNQVYTSAEAVVKPATTATGPLATVQPLTPIAMSDPAAAFTESWQRYLRRVRYRSPYMTSAEPAVAAAEPASPAQQTIPLPIQFRLGIGGELGTGQSGQGVYAEVILANRLTISTGVSQIYWAGDEYQTEQLFAAKTKRDFRRDYPGTHQAVSVGHSRPPQVVNISRAAQGLVVPVQFGFRINLGEHYVLTPSVGLNLSINPRETATFQYEPVMFRNEIRKTVTVDRHTSWYSSVLFGVGAERQWGHFVGQVGSLAMLPVRDSPASLNSLSLSLRGRIFYQF